MKRDPAAGRWPLLVRLAQYIEPADADLAALRVLCGAPQQAGPGAQLAAEGAEPHAAILVHEGWAMRHRSLADGRRQILDFVLPGDFCDPSIFVSRHSDSAVTSITAVSYSSVSQASLLDAVLHSPRLGIYLWWLEAQESALLRAHLFAVGRMKAIERVAYLIWELWGRINLLQREPQPAFEMPVSQEMLADATGLSVVHICRTLGQLEREAVIRRAGHVYHVLEPQRLRELAQVSDDQHWPEPMPARIRRALERI
jgi:CRP-like cAMP-binding protein